ncbi:type II secretion system F family protein [Streptomyces radicis]|uniref:Type II secretion protein F n=1 Tax=Streptomyces radicis TaxID=1750517 RepID=A0A3A9WG88_9ACTN|nr:type II secretion system F family protein [Streptomyces radicis]RKN11642.1 type II secretion protein F [Streptomyces radicis]RKN26813.1 type II secretion protein F [Streptomyces radicis]
MILDVVAVPLGALLGACAGLGLVLLVAGAMRRPANGERQRGRRGIASRLPRALRGHRGVGAVAAGLMAGALTGWPVAGLLVAAGTVTLPKLLGPDREAVRRVERMEAVATFTEMLRDTLSAAAGLEQSLLAAAEVAPAAIRREARALAGRIRMGQPLSRALEAFAEEMNDPAADAVVTGLLMASRRQAGQLAPLLGSLAESVREQVAMRQRIAAGRTSARTSVRVCCATTIALAAGLICLNRPYLEPFDSPAGQLALATAGGLFAVSFAWLHSIAAIEETPRLLAPHAPTPQGAPLVVPAQAREAVTRP